MTIQRRIRNILSREIIRLITREPEIVHAIFNNMPADMYGQIRMNLGIPVPLGSPLQASVHPPDVDAFINQLIGRHIPVPPAEAKSLDLGCGDHPRTHFQADKLYGCDIRGCNDGIIIAADLFTESIPFPSSSLDYVTAYDFIEHVPRVMTGLDGKTRFPFIELMNEIHRVLKPKGFFLSKTPAFPSKQVFQDPTHVNIITEDTFPFYFCEEQDRKPFAKIYGFNGTFVLTEQNWCHSNLLTLMQRH
jgi:SAM-dependent methyltransferase